MKATMSTQKVLLLVALLLSAIDGFPKNKETIFYYDPLLLNNRPFNYAGFSIISRGMLTVVAGNLETAQTESIPFRVYLRRNGKIINSGASDITRSLLVVDVASVLAVAKIGDDLVIEPTRKCDAKARRSIKLNPHLFNFNLLSFIGNKKDGC